MTNRNRRQATLNAELGEYADYGFQLIEPDGHCIELWFKDKKIATFNSPIATMAIIKEGCKNYLANIIRGM